MLISCQQLRLLYILPSISSPHHDPRIQRPRTTPSHLVAVLGSGGHTAEMMSLLRGINPTRYIHRTYIVSSGDAFSASKASEIENRIQFKYNGPEPTKEGARNHKTGKWEVKTVPRARKIHQSKYTAPFSSFWCLIACIMTLRNAARTSIAAPFEYPDVIITNGPATAVIVILASVVLKLFGLAPSYKMKVIYVESWARVKTLSLSGKVLLRLGVCDKFLVQWEELAKQINVPGRRNKVEWKGFLVE
jgi:beta-1,4-N-acetylglucosaminyltransferase